MKTITILISILLLGISSFAQNLSRAEQILNSRNELYINLEADTSVSLSYLNTMMSIDKVNRKDNTNEIIAYLNSRQFQQLRQEDLKFKILTAPSMMSSSKMCADLNGLRQWDCYPTYEQYLEIMQEFATKYPDLCKLIEFGKSIEGRKLLAVKISDNVNEKEAEPEVFYTSTMHGDETSGYVLMIRLIDYLLVNYTTNERVKKLVDETEIWINPISNPDGTYADGNSSIDGATRSNSKGYDLNRNFPEINTVAKSAAMQTETKAMIDFMKQHNFSLSANFHEGEEVVNYPWDAWYAPRVHADNDWYKMISREYADTVHANSYSGYMTYKDNGITYGADWYRVDGGRQDYVNYFLHGREVTVELSNTKSPSAYLLPNYWNYNYRSLLNYIDEVHYGLKGKITDEDGKNLRAKVSIVNHDKDSSEIYSNAETAWYYRMLSEGDYQFLVSCTGYLDAKFTASIKNNETKRIDVVLKKKPTSLLTLDKDKGYSIKYNNPVINYLHLQYTSAEACRIHISIFNNLGVQLIQKEINTHIGNNIIDINFADMKKGYYICRVDNGRNHDSFIIVKP